MGHGAFDELPCSADGRLWMMDFIYVLRLRFCVCRVLTERCWYGEFRVLNWSGLIGELVSTRFPRFLCTYKPNRNANSCDEIFAKHSYRYHLAIKQIGANFQRKHLNTFPFFEQLRYSNTRMHFHFLLGAARLLGSYRYLSIGFHKTLFFLSRPGVHQFHFDSML